MAAVARLVTLVDIRDEGARPASSRTAPSGSGWTSYNGPTAARADHKARPPDNRMSVSARHEALLADGRRVLLLDDRGWSEEGNVPDIWAVQSVEDIEETARSVVGPDEPYGGRLQEDMEADHWASLSEILRRQGVVVDAQELKRLPHVVVLSERLLARVARDDLSP